MLFDCSTCPTPWTEQLYTTNHKFISSRAEQCSNSQTKTQQKQPYSSPTAGKIQTDSELKTCYLHRFLKTIHRVKLSPTGSQRGDEMEHFKEFYNKSQQLPYVEVDNWQTCLWQQYYSTQKCMVMHICVIQIKLLGYTS